MKAWLLMLSSHAFSLLPDSSVPLRVLLRNEGCRNRDVAAEAEELRVRRVSAALDDVPGGLCRSPDGEVCLAVAVIVARHRSVCRIAPVANDVAPAALVDVPVAL